MFEKLIVSEADGIGKSRRTYFVTSSIIVGLIFLTAVVLSIYAGDFGLSDVDLELSQLSAPVETVPTEPEPEPVRQQAPAAAKSETTVKTNVRTPDVVERMDASPKVPEGVSTQPNSAPTAPKGSFEIGKLSANAATPGSGRGDGPGGDGGEAIKVEEKIVEPDPIPDPPRRVEKPKTPVVKSKGVINGEAKHLPIPAYSQLAKMAGASGLVKVQVTLDETGKVVAASAVEGHVLLRREAEQAARNARFSPTILNDTPVKVTGVIIYNFKK
jgi:TonB family protein